MLKVDKKNTALELAVCRGEHELEKNVVQISLWFVDSL